MLSKKPIVPLLMLPFFVLSFVWVAQSADQAQPKDVMILKGNPMGAVKFPHKLHAETYAGGKCETCHHPSKPQKPATAPQQACRDCHSKPLPAGMKTQTRAAFHNPMAKSGTCIDCHLKEKAAGKNPPTKCMQCHKKSNG